MNVVLSPRVNKNHKDNNKVLKYHGSENSEAIYHYHNNGSSPVITRIPIYLKERLSKTVIADGLTKSKF